MQNDQALQGSGLTWSFAKTTAARFLTFSEWMRCCIEPSSTTERLSGDDTSIWVSGTSLTISSSHSVQYF